MDLIVSGKSRELVCSLRLSLFAPKAIIDETYNHKEEIIAKSGISESDFYLLINTFLSAIHIVPEEEFKDLKEKALSLVTHQEDSPFMALALSRNIPLWSDDKALKKQKQVIVFTTTELLAQL